MRTQKITMKDGAETVIEWYGEHSEHKKGVVAFFPALGVSIRFYRSFIEHWASQGYCIAMVETRGQQQSSVKDVKRNNFGYKEVVTQDMATAIEQIRQQVQAQPFYLAGHSLGGQFALLFASRFNIEVTGVLLVAGGSNYYASMPTLMRRLPRRLTIRLTRLINKTLGYFPGDKLGFGGRQPRNMIDDWSYEGLNGRYKITADEYDYNSALSKLGVPVFMLSLEGDALVPRSCADFLAAKLESAEVNQQELPASAFGRKTACHFRWAKQPEPVVEALDNWASKLSPVSKEPSNAPSLNEA